MPIVVEHNVSPILKGSLALRTGQAQRADLLRQRAIERAMQQAQFAEQQHQFDVGAALDAEGLEQRGELGRARLGLQASQLASNRELAQQQLLAEQRQFAAQLAADEEARRAALVRERMGVLGGLQREALQQQGLAARQQQGLAGEAAQQRQQQLFRQMQGDWDRINEFAQDATAEEVQEARGKFMEKYQNAGLPMPVEVPQPQVPFWRDPEQVWSMVQQQAPNAPLVPDENGMPQTLRGWNLRDTPEFIEQERQREREQAEEEFERERRKAERDLQFKTQLEAMKAQIAAQQDRKEAQLKWQLERFDLLNKPSPDNPEFRTAAPGAAGATGETVLDLDRYNAAMKQYLDQREQLMRQLRPELYGETGGQAGPQGLPGLPGPQGRQERPEGTEENPIPVSSAQDIANMRSGEVGVWPDGRRFRKR